MTVGLIGTGLIGASIGMRARGNGCLVIGYDADPLAAQEAQSRGAIDRACARSAILEQADVIVLAVHTCATIEQLESLRFTQPRAARLVIDVSSVKTPILRAARGVPAFVATHPMAGCERSGPEAASAGLFEGRPWFYVATGDRDLDWRAVEFIGSLGAVPVETDAAAHDRAVALTSHLPQVFATLFAAALPPSTGSSYCGPTAHELLRLSRSNTEMWKDVLLGNGRNVARELRAMSGRLERLADALDGNDAGPYEEQARAAKSAASSMRSS